MIFFKSRKEREFIIVSSMIRMYCKEWHVAESALCMECSELERYASKRLERCKIGENKPICKDCKIHCYAPYEKAEMRKVMRWAGPRMMYKHPFYALIHLYDSWKIMQRIDKQMR